MKLCLADAVDMTSQFEENGCVQRPCGAIGNEQGSKLPLLVFSIMIKKSAKALIPVRIHGASRFPMFFAVADIPIEGTSMAYLLRTASYRLLQFIVRQGLLFRFFIIDHFYYPKLFAALRRKIIRQDVALGHIPDVFLA